MEPSARSAALGRPRGQPRTLDPMPPDPQHDRIQGAREFFAQLRMSSKAAVSSRLPLHRQGELHRPALAALQAVLKGGAFRVEVRPDSFLLGSEVLWVPDPADNAPGRFYRDGLRYLVFKPDFSESEL